MNREEYDKIVALNFSKAKLLLKSGKHFQAGLEEKEDPLKYVVGTLVHAMCLEGKDLRSLYAIKPEGMSFATKEGKAWRAAQTLPIIESASALVVPKMAEAILKEKSARQIIEGCMLREHVIVTTMQGVKCKARLDAVGVDKEKRVGFSDIKTCLDARKEYFRNRACSEPFHYDLQAEWYASMLSLDMDFEARPWSVWIVVESKPPFDVGCYAPTDYMIESGIEKLQDVLATYKACMESGNWPGACSPNVELLDAPTWRVKQLQEV